MAIWRKNILTAFKKNMMSKELKITFILTDDNNIDILLEEKDEEKRFSISEKIGLLELYKNHLFKLATKNSTVADCNDNNL